MKDFTVEFNLSDSEYLTALRLVAGAVCTVRDIDVDTMEDFKVCVTESTIILKNCGFESVRITFSGEGAACTAVGVGGKPVECENELSLALISALIGECDIKSEGKIIRELTLKI